MLCNLVLQNFMTVPIFKKGQTNELGKWSMLSITQSLGKLWNDSSWNIRLGTWRTKLWLLRVNIDIPQINHASVTSLPCITSWPRFWMREEHWMSYRIFALPDFVTKYGYLSGRATIWVKNRSHGRAHGIHRLYPACLSLTTSLAQACGRWWSAHSASLQMTPDWRTSQYA